MACGWPRTRRRGGYGRQPQTDALARRTRGSGRESGSSTSTCPPTRPGSLSRPRWPRHWPSAARPNRGSSSGKNWQRAAEQPGRRRSPRTSKPVSASATAMNMPVSTEPCRCSAAQSAKHAEEGGVAHRPGEGPAMSGLRACRRGRRTSAPGRDRRRRCPAEAPRASSTRRWRGPRRASSRTLRTRSTPHSRRSLRAARCPASAPPSGSCRTTGARVRARSAAGLPRWSRRWLLPSMDSDCASSGISSSSSVTTTVYWLNGYGPNRSMKVSIMCSWRARLLRASAASGPGTAMYCRMIPRLRVTGPAAGLPDPRGRTGRSGPWQGSVAIGLGHPYSQVSRLRLLAVLDEVPVGDGPVARVGGHRDPVGRIVGWGGRCRGTTTVRRWAVRRPGRRRSVLPSRLRPTGRGAARAFRRSGCRVQVRPGGQSRGQRSEQFASRAG